MIYISIFVFVFVLVHMLEVSRCGFQSSPDRSTTSTSSLWGNLSQQSGHLISMDEHKPFENVCSKMNVSFQS